MSGVSRAVRVGAALSLWLTMSWALNATIYADLGRTAPLIRDVSQMCIAALSFAAAFVAVRNPGVFRARWLTVGAAVLFVAGVAAVFAGIFAGQTWLSAIGAIGRSVSVAWISVLFGMAVASLESRLIAPAIAWAFMAKYATVAVLSALPHAAEAALVVFVPVAVAIAAPCAREGIEFAARSASQASLEVTSPSSFIPFTHAFFACILVFMVASGYALSFGAVDGAPQSSLLPLGVLLIVALLSHRKEKEVSADALYAAAAVLVVAGFMFASSGSLESLLPGSSLPQGLLTAGSECFSVLAWLVVARLAKRSPVAALPAFFFFSQRSTSAWRRVRHWGMRPMPWAAFRPISRRWPR